MPRGLGRTHRRFGTPIRALAVAVPVITLVPLAIVLGGVGVWEAMQATIAVAGTGYIVAYVLVCVAAPVLTRRIGELTARAAVAAVVSAMALTGALIAYLVIEAQTGNPGVWVALTIALIAAGMIWSRRRRGGPRRRDRRRL